MNARLVRILVSAIGVLGVIGAIGVPAASAATAGITAGDTYKIVWSPDEFRYCLQDVPNNDPLFAGCSQGDGLQKMKLESATGGTWKIDNTVDNFCLDISAVGFARCSASSTQRFDINSSTDGSYKVVWPNPNGTNFCLSEYADGFEACSQGDGYERFTFQLAS